MKRAAGILLPISSLPSKYGIGCFSKEAYDFVDKLVEAGQSYWQILPLAPTGYGDSPYQSFSSFAGNPYFIDLEALVLEGVLTEEECEACDFGNDPSRIDYGKLYQERFALLRKAYERSNVYQKTAFVEFCRENAYWLDDYAVYKLNEYFKVVTVDQIKEVVDTRRVMDEAYENYASVKKSHGLRPTKEQQAEQDALYTIYTEAKKVYDKAFGVSAIKNVIAENTVVGNRIVDFHKAMAKTEEYLATAQLAYDAIVEGKYPEIINPADYSDTIKNQLITNYEQVKAIRDSICGSDDVKGELELLVDEYISKYYYTVNVIDPSVNNLDVIIYGEPEVDDTNDDYVYTKYTNDDGNIVAVTYGGKNGNDNEAKITFILNYNFFDVTVKYADKEYTIEGFGYAVVEH